MGRREIIIGAVKVHTLLNLWGSITKFILVTDGNVLDIIVSQPGAIYLMD